MTERRRGLGRGLGALIPAGPGPAGDRPVDVFFPHQNRVVAVSPEAGAGSTATALLDRPETVDADPEWVAGVSGGSRPAANGSDASAEVTAGEPRTGSRPGPAEGTDLLPTPGARYAEIAVDQIGPNERQPRQVFDEDELAELISSVREVGVLQPIVVRPREDGSDDGPAYELIMGERRWRAARAAGMEAVPAIVRTAADVDMLRDALLENLHRVQLNPLEEAAAYQQLLEDFGCTHEELAARVARSRPQISNTVRLLRLPPAIQRRVATGALSAGHARAVLSLRDPDGMERLAQRIVRDGLSVRAAEELAAVWGRTERRAPQRRTPLPSPHLDELASRLSDQLAARVQISLGQRKGRIAIEFGTPEDLDRILRVLSPTSAGAGEAASRRDG